MLLPATYNDNEPNSGSDLRWRRFQAVAAASPFAVRSAGTRLEAVRNGLPRSSVAGSAATPAATPCARPGLDEAHATPAPTASLRHTKDSIWPAQAFLPEVPGDARRPSCEVAARSLGGHSRAVQAIREQGRFARNLPRPDGAGRHTRASRDAHTIAPAHGTNRESAGVQPW